MAGAIGLKKLQRAVQTPTKLDGVKRVVQQNAAEMSKRMMKKAELVSSSRNDRVGDIHTDITDGGMSAEVTSDCAESLEFGSRFMDAQSFVRPAFKEQEMLFQKDMNKLVR